jgi:hypothetical protein
MPVTHRRPIRSQPAPAAEAVKSDAAPQDTASASNPISEREEIATLAYSYWLERGRHGGSPEQDWLRAEQEYRRRG